MPKLITTLDGSSNIKILNACLAILDAVVPPFKRYIVSPATPLTTASTMLGNCNPPAALVAVRLDLSAVCLVPRAVNMEC